MTEHHSLRADLSRLEIVDTRAMEWTASPRAGVDRKRLWLEGPVEAGRVTSLVRYAPGSRFHAHPHPEGEEILVLRGVFSDERGDHPAGTYMLNPEGYEHAPYSEEGCELLVKLRQYPGARVQLRIDTTSTPWLAHAVKGVQRLPLYAEPGHPESVFLLRMEAGASAPTVPHDGGAELLVLEGTLSDELGDHGPGTWVRHPPGSRHTPRTSTGCQVYVKSGHLVAPPFAGM